MIIKNEIAFNPTKPDGEKREPQSSLTWVPISSTTRQQLGYKLQTTEIDAEDASVVRLNHLFGEDHSIFGFAELNNRPYEFDDRVQT